MAECTATRADDAVNSTTLPSTTWPPAARRRRAQLLCVLVAAVALPAVWVLYQYPPGETSFYPRCPFFAFTGLHCPGCGTGRCLHAILHGQILQAAGYNILTLATLPFLLWYGVRRGWAAVTGRPWTGRRLPAWSIWLLFILIVAFWIMRNVPVEPLTWLAPHELTTP
jgi:hypothetical protein